MADSEERINEIGSVIKLTLETCCPNQWGEIANFFYYTHQGVGYIVKESCLQLGFGVLGDLTPSIELLCAINHINQTLNGWYVWLSDGSDNDHWSLIAGQKIFYGVTTEDKLIDLVRAVVSSQKLVIQAILNNLQGVVGRAFWQPNENDIDGWGLLLMSKIGG